MARVTVIQIGVMVVLWSCHQSKDTRRRPGVEEEAGEQHHLVDAAVVVGFMVYNK